MHHQNIERTTTRQNKVWTANRQTSEAKLRRYKDLFNLAPDSHLILDAQGNIEEANPAAAMMLNSSQQLLAGQPLTSFVAEEEREGLLLRLTQWDQSERVKEFDVNLLPREGAPLVVTLRVAAICSEYDKIACLHCTLLEVISHKRSEVSLQTAAGNQEQIIERLTTGQEMLKAALRQLPSGIIITEAPSGNLILSNERIEQLWGHPDRQTGNLREFRQGKGFHKDGRPYKVEEWPLARTLSTGEVVTDEEIDILRADGSHGTVRVSSTPVRNLEGRVIAAVEITFDFTELKHAQEQIQEQIHEQAAILDESEDAIVVREMDGRILFWNKGAELIFGWTAEEAAGQNVRDLLFSKEPSGFDQANAPMFYNEGETDELRLVTKDGREIMVERKWTLMRDEAGNLKSVLVIMTDITKTKKIEAQLFRLQRLDSIGALAAGIAHDLGNALAPILMTVQLLKSRVNDESSERYLDMIQRNVNRSVDLVKRVLGFVRGVEDERDTLKLRPLIYEIEKMLKGTLPKSIAIEISIEKDLWSAVGNATQIHQMIMNLCVNARDAMPEGGRLLIAVENVSLNETEAQLVEGTRPGSYVLIRVSDTGTGIPAHIMKEIFNPFFTTKEESEGTGLGLATVDTIVKDHQGFISITSEVGKGSEFKIYLPATEATNKESGERTKPPLPIGHGELVLVADDEAAVREITKEVLETYGYQAITASDGMEAVLLYSRHKDRIQVVLMDLLMPYLDGREIIRIIRSLDPEVKIIVTSGTANEDFADTVESFTDKFLLKPYSARNLLETIADLLAKD